MSCITLAEFNTYSCENNFLAFLSSVDLFVQMITNKEHHFSSIIKINFCVMVDLFHISTSKRNLVH